MRTDEGGRISEMLGLVLAIVFVLAGCVSTSPEPRADDGGEPWSPPEALLTAGPGPDAPESVPSIAHRPAVPRPDALVWVPSTDTIPKSTPRELTVLPVLPVLPAPPVPYRGPAEVPETPLYPPTASSPDTRAQDKAVPIPAITLRTPSQEPVGDADTGDTVGEETGPSHEPRIIPELDQIGSITRPEDVSSADDARSVSSDVATAPRPDREQGALSARWPREDTSGEQTVVAGRRFHVSLPGRGWVFLGGGENVQFLDRSAENDSVVFSFRGASSSGATEDRVMLEFESQDLATGRRTRHEEQILLVQAEREGGTDDSVPIDSVRTGARVETDGGHIHADRSSGAGVTSEGMEGASFEELLRTVDEFEESQDYRSAVSLLEDMRLEAAGSDDELIFRLAQLYEAEWDGRDLRVARDLYQSLVDDYPLSRRRRRARERIEYLNRHFFHIR
ncbi:MAG: hypothetical protein WD492_08810 [Alkalispirochaeta sp.]